MAAIKSITVRFNKEVMPFQHIRVEASATITKKDDPDTVATELENYVEKVYAELEAKIYPKEPLPVAQPKTEDNIPY